VVGPLLRHLNGSLQRSYFPLPGTLGWFLENKPVVWLLRCLPVGRERFLCFTPPTEDRVVPWILGAALLLRRTAFEAVGGFDESYFMYFEEVDLCLRLRAVQSQVHFTPSATVLHVNGASTSQCRKEMHIAHFRSAERFYRRHYSGRRAWFWISLMKLKIAMKLVRDVVRLRMGPDERTGAMLSQQIEAWKAVLRGLPEHPAPTGDPTRVAEPASRPRLAA
jgi:GT2 family glycosyltransferase